jgi:hypothetical protein
MLRLVIESGRRHVGKVLLMEILRTHTLSSGTDHQPPTGNRFGDGGMTTE